MVAQLAIKFLRGRFVEIVITNFNVRSKAGRISFGSFHTNFHKVIKRKRQINNFNMLNNKSKVQTMNNWHLT